MSDSSAFYNEMHDIGNTYGGLHFYETGGKFFWYIEDYDSYKLSLAERGEEIPESLYRELLAHYYEDKPERDREEAIQLSRALESSKAQAEQWVVWAEEEKASVYHVVCDVTGMITLGDSDE